VPQARSAIPDPLAVNASTALRMAERLEASGMLERAVNAQNRREIVISLTDTGRAIVDDVTERRRHELAEIIARMPAKRRRQLVRTLDAFADAAGEPPIEPGALGWT
jgi:DNA-binding MarR family transcriptional regulator